MGNHTMSVITDGEQYEKIVVFGGIKNEVKRVNQITSQEAKQDSATVMSFLSNKCFLVSIQQRSAGKLLFNQEAKVATVK